MPEIEQNNRTGNEIAVIGMAGKFPDANNIEEFWDNLKNGVESITYLSDEELKEMGAAPALLTDTNFVKSRGGVFEDKEYFDAWFFDYTPIEAEIMHPQLRILHETVWEALENAGYVPDNYNRLIGLYAGASSSFYWEVLSRLSGKDNAVGQFEATHLIDKDFLTTRTAYRLNLRGPAITVQSACSTSLLAIHMASQAILDGECDIALAGGVTIIAGIEYNGYMYEEGLVFSPDGHCRAFDTKANGTVGGNGSGIVVLKALEDAIRDGDYIHAVIKGTAINNDGINKAAFSAPSITGQVEVIRMAHQVAEVEPETIGYIEAHGTGTSLGDPIEIQALKKAFHTNKNGFCAIGSVKTNIGHLDSAAGVAGFIKTVLALKNKQIPPSLHFEIPNPKIDFENSPFYVNNKLAEWKNLQHPLRAGVSAFGIGGTNAHVILEEAPVISHSSLVIGENRIEREYQLILLSAKTKTALGKMSQNLAEYFKKNPGIDIADAAYTLQVGRKNLRYKSMTVCSTTRETIEILTSPDSTKLHTYSQKNEHTPVIFMFSGQGSQYVNMGLQLYREEPVFRREVDKCLDILATKMGYSIKDILYPDEGKEEEAREKINDVLYSGPVKFTFEYALANLIMHWGIKPYAMIGHSFGEYAAAQLAGVFSLEDALSLVVLRGQLMQKTADGTMMSVPLPEEELKPLLSNELSLAAVNAPSLCVVSGPTPTVRQLQKTLEEKGYECLNINFPRASHSKMMNPIVKEFKEVASQVKLNKPKIPYISGSTGNWLSVEEATDPEYWANHMVKTIRFYDGINKLLEKPNAAFIQVGPDRGLPLFLSQHPGIKTGNLIVNLVKHPKEKVSDVYYILNKLGLLWLHGVKIDWKNLDANKKKHRIPLPTYPFEKQRYWIEGNIMDVGAKMFSGAGWKKRTDITDWFYIPSWTRSPLPVNQTVENREEIKEKSNWLVFIDENHLGAQLVNRLKQKGHTVVSVKPGLEYKQETGHTFTINHKNKEHYDQLLKDLKKKQISPDKIAHLWSVDGGEDKLDEHQRIDTLQNKGLYSLLYLSQAIGNSGFTDPLFLAVVTSGIQEVNGEEMLFPGSATVMGPLEVIPIEYANISCRCIDIVLPGPNSPRENTLVSQLAEELQSKSPQRIVAYRGNHRWEQTFKPFPLEESNRGNSLLRENGVYLITGGLGGIGMELAEFIASCVKAKLVLTGRSIIPGKKEWGKYKNSDKNLDSIAGKIRKIQKLEELRAEVLALSADVTNQQQMHQVIRQTEKRFGQINGIIHSVGVPGGGVIQLQTKEMVDRDIRAKVMGTIILNQSLKTIKPDFFILCSSVSSIMPAFGQVSYCAANAFLDAFAEYNTAVNRVFTTAVNWTRWRDTGMTVAIEEKHKKITGEGFSGGITPAQGIELFNRILGQKVTRIIASESDFLQEFEQSNKGPQDPEESHIKEVSPETAPAPTKKLFRRPELSTKYAAPENDTQKKLAEILQNFFGYQQVGKQDDFFELGGDSLKATVIIQRIHKEMNVKITLPEFFANPTIAELAAFITGAGKSEYYSIKPVETREYYLQSPAQVRIYLLQQMEPGATAYHVRDVFQLEGELDQEKLKLVFRELIKRHESLRTSFFMVNEIPVQEIHTASELEFKIEYYKAGTKEEQTEIISDFERPFDLSQPPLIRIGLVEIEPLKHLLMVDTHHIITDGTSCLIFTENFLYLFQGHPLPRLRLQYKDFSQWQQHPEVKEALKQQENYWLKEFTGEIPVLDLPVDWPRPAMQSFEGHHIAFGIEWEETKALNEIARQQGATLFMVLMSLYYILLYKLSNQEDIVVGTPTAGRNHPDLEHIIGMFINTLPLRNFPSGEKTVSAFIEEIKQRTLTAFENQDYPFEELVEKAAVERDLSHSPLFDTMFILQNFSPEPGKKLQQKAPGLNYKNYAFESGTSKFDIMVTALEQAQMLLFIFEYCTRLFRETTMQRFINYFKRIISAVVKAPGIKIADIEIISAREKKQLLFDFDDTRIEYPKEKTIHRLFEEQVERTPNQIALVFNHAALAYRELQEKSNQLAAVLRQKGVKPDTIAAVLVEPTIEIIIGTLAILKAGGAYLPIDVDYPADRIRYMLMDSNSNFLVTTRTAAEKLTFQKENFYRLYLEEKEWYQGDGRNLARDNRHSDLAYIIYTSGTTGHPKGMLIHHRNVVRLMKNDKFLFDFDSTDIWTLFHSYCFDFSVWEMYGALLYGGQLVIIPKMMARDTPRYLEVLKQKKVTVLNQTPSAFYHLSSEELKYPDKQLHIKYVIFGGEALNPAKLTAWKAKYPATKLINMFGITETTVHVTFKEISQQDMEMPISNIGKPIPTLSTYILDSHSKLLPVGVPGECYVGGEGVGRGYLNRPELTREKFIDNPYKSFEKTYRSGDLIRFLENGDMEYLGRIDQQVKIRGFRIELKEIENQLLKHDDIKEAVVSDRVNPNGDRYLYAYIVPHTAASPETFSISRLRGYLAGKLPDYMVPSYFIRLEKIPLTPNGKVNLKALPVAGIETVDIGVYTPPQNKIEEKLARIWHELLGIGKENISMEANFFTVGGHSLKATLLAARVHKEFAVRLPMVEIFRTPTIRDLARYIKNASQEKFLAIKPTENKEYYPLSPAQKRLYFVHLMTPDNTAYNQPITLVLEGDTDKNRLEKTFKQLIARHESLRTTYVMLRKESMQRIQETADFEIQYYEPNPDPEKNVIKIIDDFVKPFVLAQAPLLRAALVKIQEKKHVLVVDIHHIATDGVSDNIMVRDFMYLYSGRELPPLRLQYKDFSQWQNQRLESDQVKKQEEYWLNRFKGQVPVLDLPFDHPRPTTPTTHEGGMVNFTIEQELAENLNVALTGAKTTMFMFLLAVYYILLAKHSSQEDIIVGSPVSGRRHDDLQNIMGLFINMLSLRNQPNPDKTFKEFLEEVKENALDAYENQDYQFDQLVGKLGLHGTSNQNPLFQVIFADVDTDTSSKTTTNTDIKPYEYEKFISKFDLRLAFTQQDNQVLLSLQYSKNLFKESTIRKMTARFVEILQQVLENNEIPLKDITLSHKLLTTRSHTLNEYEETFDF